ncbi:hypothetical protein KCP78_02965 [Salmonella enterica subsp. enterica]|nr:hypothetical protein KCP78_02965 [Salmonella enterica subsp. enterica]
MSKSEKFAGCSSRACKLDSMRRPVTDNNPRRCCKLAKRNLLSRRQAALLAAKNKNLELVASPSIMQRYIGSANVTRNR